MKNLTAKKVLVCIKNGFTPEMMQERFEATWEELEKKIQQLYSEGNGEKSREIIQAFEANRKKSRRHKKPAETVSEPIAIPEPEKAPEPAEESTNPVTVADLKAKEAELSQEVIDLEGKHKALFEKRHKHVLTLRALQDELSEIRKSLQSCRDRYETTCQKADQIAIEMNQISSVRAEKQVALEKVRLEIESKSTVTFYIYDSGAIEAPDNPDIKIDFSGSQEIKAKLTERSDCQEFRLRDLDALSKVLAISEKIDKVNLVFENEELEIVYQIIWDEAHPTGV